MMRRVLKREVIVEELTAKMNRASTPERKEALELEIQRHETAIQIGRQRVNELLDVKDRTLTGQRWLEQTIADPETPEDEREVLRLRLNRVREEAAADNRFVRENRTKIENTKRAMEQAGFSEEDMAMITARFLARGMNRLPVMSKEAEEEKRAVVLERRAFQAKLKALKDAVDEDETLDREDRREAKQEIDDEFAPERAVLEERLRLAKYKYDATPAGFDELRKGYERKLAEGDTYMACSLKARMVLAEREIKVRANERNARSAMKRAIIKAAKKAGADPQMVWGACKSIQPVNVDGTPIRIKDDVSKSPAVRLSQREVGSLREEASQMPEFSGLAPEEAVKELFRKRVLDNSALIGKTDGLKSMNDRAVPVRHSRSSSTRRDQSVYPYFTAREYEVVTTTAKSLGVPPAAYLRSLALNDPAALSAVVDRKAQRKQWRKKVRALAS